MKDQFNKYNESLEQLNKLKKLEIESSDISEDEKYVYGRKAGRGERGEEGGLVILSTM